MPAASRSPQKPTRFGRLLTDRITERDLTIRSFALATKVSHVYVLGVISGNKPMALGRLAKWMQVLQLEGAERDAFRVEGIIASCRQEAQQLFRDFQLRIHELEQSSRPG